jgi:hypothetical protein
MSHDMSGLANNVVNFLAHPIALDGSLWHHQMHNQYSYNIAELEMT